LKQLQYFKIEDDVLIYHYAASFLPVSTFRSLLTRKQHGYVNTLVGPDTLSSTATPPGDEPPRGCLEVGYLPYVFILGGSALGFRIPGDPPTIEWLCFDQDIKSSILDKLDINTDTQTMLFELVASLSRAPPPNKKWSRTLVYTEHKDWWESLKEAGRIPFRLGMTWRTLGTELYIEAMRKRDEQERAPRVRWERNRILGGVADVDDVDAWSDGNADWEDEDTGVANQRDAESPETLGRRTPFVYRDPPVPGRNVTPQRSNHSRSSSNVSMLSDRSTNTRRKQPTSATKLKSREQLLLEGGYV
jgi:hypothetical protein